MCVLTFVRLGAGPRPSPSRCLLLGVESAATSFCLSRKKYVRLDPLPSCPAGGLRCELSPCPAAAHPQELASSASEKERCWPAVRSTPSPHGQGLARRQPEVLGREQVPSAIPPGPQDHRTTRAPVLAGTGAARASGAAGRALAAARESRLQAQSRHRRQGCITSTSP